MPLVIGSDKEKFNGPTGVKKSTAIPTDDLTLLSSFNAATTLPQILPSFQNTNISLFFDAANIWGVDYNSGINDDRKIRSSIGLAIDFFTPIGPLNFSLSEPITKGKNDITESFRFNLGTSF